MSDKAFQPKPVPADDVTREYQPNEASDIPTVSAVEPAASLAQDDLDAIRKLRDGFNDIKRQLARVIVGQAAVLEAMQERQVTVGRVRHRLSDPFFVLATQNPIEQEGTYPLPEAQQDRFMFKVFVDYPSFREEFEIARRTTTLIQEDLRAV